MSKELPKGWAMSQLAEIAELNPRHPKGLNDSLPVSFARMPALSESKPEFNFLEEKTLGEVRKGFTHFAEGDVLFAKITPCMENGKGAVARQLRNGIGCGTTELHVIRSLAGISPEYIYRFLAQEKVRRDAKDNFTGSAGQARVPTSFIENLELPIAPLAEQQRIVAKLEALLSRTDSCRARLETIPAILKRFRQSVLAAACSGKLTADWRESDVFEDELPFGWKWAPIESLLPKGGIFDGPFGSNLKSGDYTNSGVRVVRLENIGQLRFIAEKETFVSHEKYEALKKHTVGEGDIIFASFISEEIRACVLPKLSTTAIAKADCFCLRPKLDLVDRNYLVFRNYSAKQIWLS
jgi:type I restriction enzyme, S subunit